MEDFAKSANQVNLNPNHLYGSNEDIGSSQNQVGSAGMTNGRWRFWRWST